jgi:hypothetical protein
MKLPCSHFDGKFAPPGPLYEMLTCSPVLAATAGVKVRRVVQSALLSLKLEAGRM